MKKQLDYSSVKIQSITACIHDTGFGGYPYKYTIIVTLDAKLFKALKGDLGILVLDVNNMLYSINNKIPAHNPSIDSNGTKNAKKGVKTMEFCYFDRSHERAESLGFEMYKFKGGEVLPKYGQNIKLK